MKKYYLGLDMGTDSIGWAVTDEKYEILRAKGKDLWGIREFDEAKTAVDRRNKRISRRRREREIARIGYLKSYFADAIEAVDTNFYGRLENSKYILEDKQIMGDPKTPNGIFADKNYQDINYYKQYPTIFHLRRDLIENKDVHDVRLVFLALLNMFKHRGHFLNTGLSTATDGMMDVKGAYLFFREKLIEDSSINFPSDVDFVKIEEILGSNDSSRSEKVELLRDVLKIEKEEKTKIVFLKMICGLRIDARNIFEDIREAENKIEINFSEYGFEDKASELELAIGSNHFDVVDSARNLYNVGMLSSILRGKAFISYARVEEYEKHKKDLKILKKLVKTYGSSAEYDKLFRSEEAGSYAAYVNSSISHGVRVRRSYKDRKRENLYKSIKSVLSGAKVSEEIQYVLSEMEKGTYLPKQLTADNGVIPNQVYVREMRAILENAKEYLPFLLEKDESGLTVSQRILELFSFQIPYYIGPTSENSAKYGGNGWVVRKQHGEVLPWNLEKMIDVEQTSQQFIQRLIKNCTYISGEKVMPKSSLLYQKFAVLNEINPLEIDGHRISVELKHRIYSDLFQKGKKVTKKQIERYLINNGDMTAGSVITGVDETINSVLSTYGKFYSVFGERLKTDTYKKMADRIVYLFTIYGDSKKLLKNGLEKEFGSVLSENELKRVLGMKFKDWGRLSEAFLNTVACDKSTGEQTTLLSALWKTNLNMMELIHSDMYTFREEIEEKTRRINSSLWELKPEDLEDFYFSAPVKRMIWQTILIVKEVSELMGCVPQRLFVETVRSSSGERGKRTVTRAKMLSELYRNIKSESQDWQNLIQTADASGKLRSKKMYLYLKQMGRCMYTGTTIELNELFDNNKYDIDHIYPRHFIKDDNLENNLVLVKKQDNAHKSDNYPLESSIQTNASVIALWNMLRDKKFITEEKYKRLTRNTEFTDEDKAGFIARQLVETSQATKGVTTLLEQVMGSMGTKVIYSKASNVSDFRHEFGFPKVRSVNDFHHANDAYLNIVVGNAYYVKFTANPLTFIKQDVNADRKHYNICKMFNESIQRGDELAWIVDKKGKAESSLQTVKRMMAKQTPLLTRKAMEGKGALTNDTIYSAQKAKETGYYPLKTTDERMKNMLKYGGYSSISTCYFFLVEHEEKKKRIRTLETVPLYLKERIERRPEELELYCLNVLQLKKPSIRIRKIKLQSLFRVNDYYGHITGVTGKRLYLRNSVALSLANEWMQYIARMEKCLEKNEWIQDEGLKIVISSEKNIELYDVLVEKHLHSIYVKRLNPIGEKLVQMREKFIRLSVDRQCKSLFEMLKLTAIGLPKADLTDIGGSESSGVMLLGKEISKCDKFQLIIQSITGVYEKRIDLLKV